MAENQKERLVIVGGVAAGATAAARARRMREDLEIILLERGPYISYANCGLPYFIGGDISDREELILQTPEDFGTRYRVDARVNTEVLEIDRSQRRVLVGSSGKSEWLAYDRLILAQGGLPIMPDIPGAKSDHVFRLWTVPDMDRLHQYITEKKPATAVIVGGGFIGIEMAEAFVKRGLKTTVVELGASLLSSMDEEFGRLIESELGRHGVQVRTGVGVTAVDAERHEVQLGDGSRVSADLVLFSVGVRPELAIAKKAGLEVGASGGLLVNESLVTSDPAILAAGDMIEVEHRVNGRRVRVPLAGPANRQGRIAATVATGGKAGYGGVLGTSIVKVMDATAGSTGLTEKAARASGYEQVGVAVIHKGHHASYFPGAKEMTLKLIYDRKDGKLLGAQAYGEAGVESRINALAVALSAGQTLEDLAEVDLVYAPPYSTANDPVNLGAFVGLNDINGFSPLLSASALRTRLEGEKPPVLLDVRGPGEWKQGHLAGAIHVPVDELRDRLNEVPKGREILVICRSGFRGHIAARILRAAGYQQVSNLTGGMLSIQQHGGFSDRIVASG